LSCKNFSVKKKKKKKKKEKKEKRKKKKEKNEMEYQSSRDSNTNLRERVHKRVFERMLLRHSLCCVKMTEG